MRNRQNRFLKYFRSRDDWMKNKKIISILPEGLTYQNGEGDQIFIDFEECRINFLKWLQKENERTDEEMKNLNEKTKCVAVRNAFEEPRYIEFFTEPRVRFEFKKSWIKDSYKEYRSLNTKIIEAGWKTFDLG